MKSLAALLRKEFSAPTSSTGGLQAYSLEGQDKSPSPESRAALLKPKKQLTSLVPLIEKGDKPGHEFRGNQYQTKTARDAEATRLALAERVRAQEKRAKPKNAREIDAYQMMGAAVGDVGTTVHYTEDSGTIVAAVGYQRREADLHVGFLGSIRRGEGAKLLSRVEATADKEGLPVTLMALSGSKPFYEARGYKVTDPVALEMIRMPKPKAQKWDYAHPETCPCCAQNGAHAVLKAAPASRVRSYVENSASALKSAIHGLLQKWAKKWAKQISKGLPVEAAEKVSLSRLTKASTKTAQEILDEIDLHGFSVALMDEMSPRMAKAFKDGGLVAREMVGLENDAREMLALMDEDALAFAKDRAAELVGMRRVDGKLVDNPNARWSVSGTTRDGLRSLVSEAIETGWGPQELTERILDSFFFSDKRAEMIARTELAFAHVQGNLKGWKDTGVVAGKRSILADTHPFEDVCDENELQGVVPLDEPFQDGSMGPPYHPNCVLPDTKLSAFGVLKAYKRWFIGEVVSLLCEGDHNLAVTPNHPVLTQRGWIPAGQVKIGDFLFKSVRPDLIVPLISPDHYYMPTPAHELFDSLVLSGSVRPVIKLSGASAFHGDGITDSEVHVVDSNGLLRVDWKSQLKKHLKHLLFPVSQLSGFLVGLGSKFFGLDRVFMASAGQEGMRGYSATFSKVTSGVKKGLSLKPSPQRKPPPLEVFIDGSRVTVEALSEIYSALTGKIAPVQVLDISVSEYRGHVFNLSTKDGWYFADGIITHNCLCDIVPVLDDEMPGYKKLDKGDKPGHPFRGNQWVAAVDAYVSGDSLVINSTLAAGKEVSAPLLETVKGLDAYLKDQPRSTEDKNYYRVFWDNAAEAIDSVPVGEIYTNPAFMSTSSSKAGIQTVMGLLEEFGPERTSQAKISVPKGSKAGGYIKGSSGHFNSQEEFLFSRGASFYVLGRHNGITSLLWLAPEKAERLKVMRAKKTDLGLLVKGQ